jgi:hypothetical protein
LSVNNSAAGREETASITGEGTGYLVVSSVDSLEGTFRIREHPASEVGSAQTVANLTPEVPQAGEVRADVTQVWTIAGSEDLPTGVVVRPIGTLDPVLVVKLPDEQEVRIDQLPVGAIEYVLLPPGLGTFEVVVEGYDGTEGAFEIESELVEPELLTPSDLDEPVAYAEGPTTYVVETSDPAALLALTAQPGPSSAVVAQLVIDETVRSAAGYGGEPAQLILSGAASDIHLVTVIPSDSWSVAVKLQPIEPLPIEVGAPVTAEGTNAFTTEVPPDSVLNFTVEPLGAPFLSVDLISPSGDMIPAAESEEEGSPVTVNIGSSQGGTYQVVVTPMPGQGDYEARLEPG